MNGIFSLLLVLAGSTPAMAQQNLIERTEAALAKSRLPQSERLELLSALRQELGAYAFDVVKKDREPALEVLLAVLVEGVLGEAPVARTVGIAKAAYVAVSRGAPADAALNIALYGFQNQVDAGRIEAWANGYHLCMQHGVSRQAIQELVWAAARHGMDLEAFNAYKWALVRAKQKGLDPRRFAMYLIGHHLQTTDGPGGIVRRANQAFQAAGPGGPSLPRYEPVVIELQPKKPASDQATKPPTPDGSGKTTTTTAPSPAPTPGINLQATRKRLLTVIESYLGTPYVWGGRSRRGTDCSGLTQAVYEEAGLALPRTVSKQFELGRKADRDRLLVGDLVFFITIGNRVSHVGMATGPGQDEFIHASSSRGVVRSQLASRYYDERYLGARRILPGP